MNEKRSDHTLREAARGRLRDFGDDGNDVEIDEFSDNSIQRLDDGGAWVRCWIYVPPEGGEPAEPVQSQERWTMQEIMDREG